jgi:hypothetical protein
VSTECPSPADLVPIAFAPEGELADPSVIRHVKHCTSCGGDIAEWRELAAAMRSAPQEVPTSACLDEVEIAHLVDGVNTETDHVALAHLAACPPCRATLASVSRIMRDQSVASEVERLVAPVIPQNRRRPRMAIATGLAAAALAAVLLWPEGGRLTGPGPTDESEAYRERTITTTEPPRILAPVGMTTVSDSLRWSNVPGADLYRVTFWERDGSVAWEGDARDTVLAVPPEVMSRGTYLFWQVKARTGWDRWVGSELVEFTHTQSGGVPR